MNGPAAHKVHVGHVVIIVSYARMTIEEARSSVLQHHRVPDERTNRLRHEEGR
jgi:aspartate 1-decarboxylase